MNGVKPKEGFASYKHCFFLWQRCVCGVEIEFTLGYS